MSKNASPKVIGGFILGAIVLVVAGAIIFGSFRFFQQTERAVMYFQGSVQGLRVGTPVTFRGVNVGEVETVNVHFDPADLSFTIPVKTRFFPENIRVVGGYTSETNERNVISKLVEKGLRARLVPLSLVTGQLSIQLDFFTGTAYAFKAADQKLPEIPTVPSTVEKLENVLITIANAARELDMEALAKDFRKAAEALTALATKPELAEMITNADAVLIKMNTILTKVDDQIDPLLASVTETTESADALMRDGRGAIAELRATLADTRQALISARTLLTSADDAIDPRSPLYGQLLTTLLEITSASRALAAFANELERNPRMLLFGRQAPSRR